MRSPVSALRAARQQQRRSQRDDPDANVKEPEAPVLMEGFLKKQGARVGRWSGRYAVLRGPKLTMQHRQQPQSQDAPPAGQASAAAAAAATGGVKREFVLMSGCHVSEVRELPNAAGKGRSLWEFRLHWPEHVRHYGRAHGAKRIGGEQDKTSGSAGAGAAVDVDSDDEDDDRSTSGSVVAAAAQAAAQAAAEEQGGDSKQHLQRVAGQTARTAKQQKNRAAEIERSEMQHQSLVSRGATVAGVVVGGVVIGALTAGVGLVPYLGLVGTAAVVSGGAVAYTASQSPSNRLVLAAETEAEAMRWKGALELQIAVLEGRRPPPPPEIDLQDIDRLINSTAWKAAGAVEGLRVLEEVRGNKPRTAALCRKMQTVVSASPIKFFLGFMATDGPYQPPAAAAAATNNTNNDSGSAPAPAAAAAGAPVAPAAAGGGGATAGVGPGPSPAARRMAQSLTTVQTIDDHTDVVHILLQPLPAPTPGGPVLPSATSAPPTGPLAPYLAGLQQRLLAPRDFCVMRYWRLDDDGAYVVCLTSVAHDACPPRHGVVRGTLHCVLSIAPRKDYARFEEDLPEALVTYIVEVNAKGALDADEASLNRFTRLTGVRFSHLRAQYADLVLSQVLDVKEQLDLDRFKPRDLSGLAPASAAAAALGGPGHHGSGSSRFRALKARLYGHSSHHPSSSLGGASGSSSRRGSRRLHHQSSSTSSLSVSTAAPAAAAAAATATGTSAEEAARAQQVAAAALRARIAAKEYEARRLELEIGRASGGAAPLMLNVGAGAVLMASGGSGSGGGGGASSSSSSSVAASAGRGHSRDHSMELLRQLQAQVDEASRLKAEYRQLTGRDYGPQAPLPASQPEGEQGRGGASASSSLSPAPSATSSGSASASASVSPSRPGAAAAAAADPATYAPSPERRRESAVAALQAASSLEHGFEPRGGHRLSGSPSSPRKGGGGGGGGFLHRHRAREHHQHHHHPREPHSARLQQHQYQHQRSGSLGGAGGVSSPLSSSAPAAGGAGAGAAAGAAGGGEMEDDDPFRWQDGVPDHWVTRQAGGRTVHGVGAAAAATWEVVVAKLVVVLLFCFLFFTTLSVRRFLPAGPAGLWAWWARAAGGGGGGTTGEL